MSRYDLIPWAPKLNVKIVEYIRRVAVAPLTTLTVDGKDPDVSLASTGFPDWPRGERK